MSVRAYSCGAPKHLQVSVTSTSVTGKSLGAVILVRERHENKPQQRLQDTKLSLHLVKSERRSILEQRKRSAANSA
jgi:hypothetical protein